MKRAFNQVGLHWFGENRQVRMSIPSNIVPKGAARIAFRETRSGIMFWFPSKHGSTLSVRTPKTHSACLPLDISRRLLGMDHGINCFTLHWRQEGFVIHVAIRKKEGA